MSEESIRLLDKDLILLNMKIRLINGLQKSYSWASIYISLYSKTAGYEFFSHQMPVIDSRCCNRILDMFIKLGMIAKTPLSKRKGQPNLYRRLANDLWRDSDILNLAENRWREEKAKLKIETNFKELEVKKPELSNNG